MERFEVGEIAIYIGPSFIEGAFHMPSGVEVTVTSKVFQSPQSGRWGYTIDPGFPPPKGNKWFCGEENLRKKKPPRTLRECDLKVEWNDCLWQPKTLVEST